MKNKPLGAARSFSSSAALIAAVAVAFSSTMHAATYFSWVDQNNISGLTWDDLGAYTDNGNPPPSDGGDGIVPMAFAGNDFFSNGFQVRAPGTTTFAGDNLTMNGGDLALFGGASSPTIATLIMNGSDFVFGSGGQSLSNIFNITSLSMLQDADIITAGRGYTFAITTLTGSGNLTAINNGDTGFTIGDATGYTGTINVGGAGSGSAINDIDFNTDIVSGGGLVVGVDFTNFILDQNLTFQSLTVGSTVYGDGIYNAATLNADAGTTVFTGLGTINVGAVPEPSSTLLAGAALAGLLLVRRRR